MPTLEHEDDTFRDAERIGRKRAFIEYYTHMLSNVDLDDEDEESLSELVRDDPVLHAAYAVFKKTHLGWRENDSPLCSNSNLSNSEVSDSDVSDNHALDNNDSSQYDTTVRNRLRRQLSDPMCCVRAATTCSGMYAPACFCSNNCMLQLLVLQQANLLQRAKLLCSLAHAKRH